MTVLPDPAVSRALLIGVHDYATLEGLPAVERNLAGLRQAFTDPALWGLPESHCVALSQPQSAQDVLDTLTRVATQATDTLIVYYAGHGLTDPYSDELYLALPGSDQERLYSALPYEWVRRAILDPRIGARHKVVILDCCYSGRALLGGMSGTAQVADQALIEGTSLMAASAETRMALSPPDEEFTAFTGELITALTEGISEGPPLLDMQTLYRHLYTSLAAKGRPLPQQRNRNTGGLIALARNRTHIPRKRPDDPQKRPDDPQRRPDIPQKPSEPPPAPPVPAVDTPPAFDAEQDAPQDRTDTTPYGRRWKSTTARTVIVSATLATLGAMALPIALALLDHSPSGRTGGDSSNGKSTTGYDAATKDVVRASTATGGTLKFIGSRDADSWDPQRTYQSAVWNFARFYTRQLVTYDPKPGSKGTELVPDLATSRARISNEGKTYTYTLRSGATWEDGTFVTSQDIKYGIERLWAPDVISGGPTYLQQVLDPDGRYQGPYKDKSKKGLQAIETPDDNTIVFHLAKPNGDFERMLATPAASPVKQGKDTKSKYGAAPFSSGPYKFQSYVPNKSVVLVRNANWKKSSDQIRKALPDKIVVTIATNPNTVDSGLISGDYDLAFDTTGLSPSGRAKAMQDQNLRKNLDNPQSGYLRFAAFPQKVKPMDDTHCRKAVIYAADHKSLQTALGGPAAGGDIAPNMLPPGIRGADPKYDPYGVLKNEGKPDVDKAKQELRKCGRPNGFATKIAVRNDRPEYVAAAEALQASLRKAGIEAQIGQYGREQESEILGGVSDVIKGNYGIVITSWGADFPSGQSVLQPLVDGRMIRASGGNGYLEGIGSPVIYKFLDAAIAESDPNKAGELYEKINRKVSGEAYFLPFVYGKYVSWRSPRLTNVYISGAYGVYDYVSLGVGGT